jgi:hypothetical protein
VRGWRALHSWIPNARNRAWKERTAHDLLVLTVMPIFGSARGLICCDCPTFFFFFFFFFIFFLFFLFSPAAFAPAPAAA